jgi:hypothetical protein
MTSSIVSLFNRSSLRAALWIAVAILCLQLATAEDNVTSSATVTSSLPQVEHHDIAAGNQTAQNDGSTPAAATKAPPATGTATGITLMSSTACLLMVVSVAVARLF